MKILLFANTDWYLYNFRRSLAAAIQEAGGDVILLSPPGPYGKKLQELGFRWVAAPMDRRSLNPFRELLLVNWLRHFIHREGVDLVHGFTIKSAVYGSLAARLAGNRARVSAVAGMGYVFTSQSSKARVLRPAVKMLMRLALGGEKSRLILQNPDDADIFRQSHIVPDGHIRVIRGSGVDCSRFYQCATRKPGEPLRVLLAARLLWDKGINEYVTAARALKKQGREIEFLLAGSPDPGNPDAVPESTVRQWVNDGTIEWLGHVDNMPDLLASVHVMALPTAYGEGLPRSLIEAAACGVALITTDAPGCREVVDHGVDGLLVPLRDADALTEAVARLDDNPDLMTAYGKAAQQKALNEFDEQIVIHKTLAVYGEFQE